jgi:hypothetical protein
MMKLRQALEDLIATPVTQSHKKVANNSIPNRTKRKEMIQSKIKFLNYRTLQLHPNQ